MTETDFQAAVLVQYPTATFVTEDGSGPTYGEPGDVVAYVGGYDDEYVVAGDRQFLDRQPPPRAGVSRPLASPSGAFNLPRETRVPTCQTQEAMGLGFWPRQRRPRPVTARNDSP